MFPGVYVFNWKLEITTLVIMFNRQLSIPVPYTYTKSGNGHSCVLRMVLPMMKPQVAAYRDVNGDECGRRSDDQRNRE